jgi:hypothetical protein
MTVSMPDVIVCIDCGGRAHLVLLRPYENEFEPGDVATYRCEDCLDRWDVVVAGEESDDAG